MNYSDRRSEMKEKAQARPIFGKSLPFQGFQDDQLPGPHTSRGDNHKN